MKIDITSLCFGFKITKDNDSGTPAWATSIGQAPKGVCYVDTEREGLDNLVYGMMYKSHSDFESLQVRNVVGIDKKEEPRSDRERMMFSVFDDVYVNGIKLNGKYVLTFEREDSSSHKNRLHICYAKYLTYKGFSNKQTLSEMAHALGCSEDACWFVSEIYVKNQSQLHFTAVVVNRNHSMEYRNSKERKAAWDELLGETSKVDTRAFLPIQQIYYGAPGTGKSHRIKDIIKENGIDEKEQVIRITFHPDSDYSTFVGCYKPLMKPVPQTYVVEGKEKPVIDITTGKQSEKEAIVYDYTPQAFIQAYTKAWTNPDKSIVLVIEEINRGNCAQIFGDIFQLLDRGVDGTSDYEIKPDKALGDYLKGYFSPINDVEIPMGIRDGEVMKLPSNLYIWATMNTSDQSLFPIDSAFKRRWDWKYMPIDTKKENWYIKVGNECYSWTTFLEKVNNELLTDETAEDKHLGFYFCKAENNEIATEKFVGKVLFYLWNDVFKIYGIPTAIGSSKDWGYTRFYNPDGSVNEQKVADLMKQLKIVAEDSVYGNINGQIEEQS